MESKTQKGQVGNGLGITLVTVGVALIVGVFVFFTISPTLTNQDRVNDTFEFGAAGDAQTLTYTPVAPDAVSTLTLDNCTSSSYGTCVRMNTSNYTINDRTTITSLTDLGYVSVNYTSGELPTGGQTAATGVTTNTATAFTLAAVVLIVIAAALIIRNLGLFG